MRHISKRTIIAASLHSFFLTKSNISLPFLDYLLYFEKKNNESNCIYNRSYCHVYEDSQRGFGLDIRFIDHFCTRLVIKLIYNAITYFHTSQNTRAHAKSFPVRNVFTSGFLATDFNTVTVIVSLNYTFQLSHITSSLHSRTSSWALLQLTSCPKRTT
jgi:hypothetical protein